MQKFIVLVFACLLSQTAWAGWVVTYQNTDTGAESQEFYQGSDMSLQEAIYTDGHFIVIDGGARSYWKGTPQQYCEAMDAMKKEMDAQMALLPAQSRPKPISQRNITRKKLGTKSIAGYPTTGYVFFADGVSADEVWISSDSSLSGIIDFGRFMAKKMKCSGSMDSPGMQSTAIYKHTVEGSFILKDSNRQVVSVEKKTIASSQFNAPAGYKAFSDFNQFIQSFSHQ